MEKWNVGILEIRMEKNQFKRLKILSNPLFHV
jgi:hypothetical protein